MSKTNAARLTPAIGMRTDWGFALASAASAGGGGWPFTSPSQPAAPRTSTRCRSGCVTACPPACHAQQPAYLGRSVPAGPLRLPTPVQPPSKQQCQRPTFHC